jgi:ABC-type dipeptide/oligopeptide/nickel transport system ATPase component
MGGKKMNYYERGSEWRKWDLHLHTPSSYDYYDKQVTNEDIIKTLKSNEISAAVIADHDHINVKMIKELVELGKKENILILPGIELRSELGGSEAIHFIGIFPIENIDHIWDRIKGELKLTDHIIKTKGKGNIICKIEESCKLFQDLGGISSIHAGKKSNSIENLKNYVFKHKQKEDLLKNSIDIMEIGKEEDITLYIEKVFPIINYRSPLIIGSDNHDINDYNLKQNCWIKADLTFEGLKQIIYEPEERVKIQEIRPDEKNDYEVIDSIEFKDDDFIYTKILLNNNLVSIIGGRSTGKSIFLRSIARAIDKNLVNEVCGDVSDLINPNTIVKWKNGKIDTSEDSSENKIKYIPQNFLNSQIELEPDSFSNKLIKSILKSDNNYKEIFSRINNHITKFETEIHKNINDLFETETILNDLKEQKKELGSPNAIEKQIEILNENYNNFQIKEEVSDEDKELQEKLLGELENLNKELDLVEDDKSLLDEFLDYLRGEETFIYMDIIKNLSDDTKTEIFSAIFIADVIYKDSLVNLIEEKFEDSKKNIETIQENITSKKEQLETLNTKLNSSEQAKETFKKIEEEKARLTLIKEKIEEIKEIEKKYENILKDIFDVYGLFIENLEFEKKSFPFEDSAEYNNFKAELIFKTKEFQNSLENSLNKKKFSTFKKKYGIDLFDFKYNNDNFQEDLEKIIIAILNEILVTKSRKTKKNVLKELLRVYHFINFNIVEDGDKLEKMSPGKRSFTFLKVLIESDKSSWPILIDQPEDDLDANSISRSLSKFLREKKRNRQIIIVSHNPNLVVGADSEQVIIANQEGSDSRNKSKKFEYISGSIENTYNEENDSCFLYCKNIKEHICNILEGGEESFKKRQNKYNIE